MADRRRTAREAQKAREDWARTRNEMRRSAQSRFADLGKVYAEKELNLLCDYHVDLWLWCLHGSELAREALDGTAEKMLEKRWGQAVIEVLINMRHLENSARKRVPNGDRFDAELTALMQKISKIESKK